MVAEAGLELAQLLKRHRRSLELVRGDAELVFDAAGNVVDVRSVAKDVAHGVIEEFMLAAHEAVEISGSLELVAVEEVLLAIRGGDEAEAAFRDELLDRSCGHVDLLVSSRWGGWRHRWSGLRPTVLGRVAGSRPSMGQ